MPKNKETIRKENIFLYRKCLPEWHPAIDAHISVISVKKNEIIFREGDPVKGIYFMAEGVVKVHKHWGDDKELILRFAKETDIIGHRGLSTHSLVYPITATALTKATICYIDLDFFTATLKVNTGFMYDFMMFFADELQLTEKRMRDLGHLPVKPRTAKALLAIEEKFGVDPEGYISFTLSRQDIAAYIGAAYETVYKMILSLEEEGLIRTEGKQLAILERAALEALAERGWGD